MASRHRKATILNASYERPKLHSNSRLLNRADPVIQHVIERMTTTKPRKPKAAITLRKFSFQSDGE